MERNEHSECKDCSGTMGQPVEYGTPILDDVTQIARYTKAFGSPFEEPAENFLCEACYFNRLDTAYGR